MSLLKTLKGVNPNRINSIGLDVAKNKINVCFMTSSHNVFYEIGNDSQQINQFCENLKDYKIKKSTPLIIESTGDYHLLCTMTLNKAGFKIIEINPIITQHYVGHNIRGTKTDKTDAETLAKIGLLEGEKLRKFDREEKFIELKKKLKLISSLEKQIQKTKASMSNYKKTMKILGFELDLDITELENMTKEIELKIKDIQKGIEKYQFNEEETKKIENIDSIIGISPYIAKVCYIEFANKEFESKRAMLAYIGLDPKLKQSGDKNIGLRLSKRGNPYVRKKLFQAGFCAIQHSKFFKDIYDKEIQKGKHHFVGVLTVSKKMVYIMRSLLKNDTIFDENYLSNMST